MSVKESARVRQRFEDAPWLVLKMEEEAWVEKCPGHVQMGNPKKRSFSWNFQKDTIQIQHLDFSLVKSLWKFRAPEVLANKFLVFYIIKFVVHVYRSNRKSMCLSLEENETTGLPQGNVIFQLYLLILTKYNLTCFLWLSLRNTLRGS